MLISISKLAAGTLCSLCPLGYDIIPGTCRELFGKVVTVAVQPARLSEPVCGLLASVHASQPRWACGGVYNTRTREL